MDSKKEYWNYTILDVLPGSAGCFWTDDFDGDGHTEIVTGGSGLYWYRPVTLEKGLIAEGKFHVGLVFEDIDDDGFKEVFAGERLPGAEEKYMIVYYKPCNGIDGKWERHIIDPLFEGGPHDIIFGDIDGDGEREMVTIACYTSTPGVYIYKKAGNAALTWKKHCVADGVFAEGLSVGDVNGDGKLEIVCGPDLYTQPAEGPYSGPWVRVVYAPNFREMCRTAMIDITGNGRPDIVIAESEYMDGGISWFENRVLEDPEELWVEHVIEKGLVYAHSLNAWYVKDKSEVHIFAAEMSQGGWNAPYNHNARLIEYISSDMGKTWETNIIYKGEGTHQAIMVDIDGDGDREIAGKDCSNAKIQIWKRECEAVFPVRFKHVLLDRHKPYTATDILAADIDGDGLNDIVCGAWWYRNPGRQRPGEQRPGWQRYDIPGVYQAIYAYDVDGDGRQELIATRRGKQDSGGWYGQLTSELCWVKPVDPVNGIWEEYDIGVGHGDWPHSALIAPLLPGGRAALVIGYHNAHDGKYPEIFEIPTEPKACPWPKKILAEIAYGEEMLACDIDGDGRLDIAAGSYWLENLGDGTFKPHVITDDFEAARIVIADINGDGRPDIVIGQEVMDYPNKVLPFSKLAWFENPEDPRKGPWKMHVMDMVRCAHSLGIGDFDNDGEMEIVCGEHDPFWPYRSRCKVYIYKKADPQGKTWKRFMIDNRFEHHDGTKVFEVSPGHLGIISHGWQDSIYVHLWEAELI